MRAAMTVPFAGSPAGDILISRITDQESLEELARNACCLGIRQAATEKLTDQALLFELCYDNEWKICNIASKTLADQSLLIDIYNDKNNSQDVRRNAVKNIKIQSVLADIIKNENDEAVRYTAIETLTDQAALSEVARHDYNKNGRICAIKKLTDKSVLEEILNDRSVSLDESAAACGRLHDINKK